MNAIVDDLGCGVVKTGVSKAVMRQLGRLVREPLLQFLLVGAGIFVIAHFVGPSKVTTVRTIVVDSALTQRLSNLYRVQTGAPPTSEQLDHLVDNEIREEVLYREALRLGLDRDDEIVRRRLAQKIEFLSSDLASVPEPAEATLQRYYERHAAEFTIPGTATFAHIYFSADTRGDTAARQSATATLAQLQSGQGADPSHLGDPFSLQSAYADLNQVEVAQMFGHTPFVDALFKEPVGEWRGPFRSGYGWHLIFIRKRIPDAIMDFATAKVRVRDAYLERQKRNVDAQWYDKLKSRYTIVREHSGAVSPQ